MGLALSASGQATLPETDAGPLTPAQGEMGKMDDSWRRATWPGTRLRREHAAALASREGTAVILLSRERTRAWRASRAARAAGDVAGALALQLQALAYGEQCELAQRRAVQLIQEEVLGGHEGADPPGR